MYSGMENCITLITTVASELSKLKKQSNVRRDSFLVHLKKIYVKIHFGFHW